MSEPKSPGGTGYAKPPKSGQFKKGQSGNPKGRGKTLSGLATMIRKSAKERVTVQENGTRKSITKGEAAIKQLFNKAYIQHGLKWLNDNNSINCFLST